MLPDLHTHTHYSDGKHPPDFIVAEAVARGITHLAITDHDCTAAFDDTIEVPDSLTLIRGVELSCLWRRTEVHIVGLCIDPAGPTLDKLVGEQQARRQARMAAMSEKLAALGTEGLADYVDQLPCVASSRSHAAEFLVEKNVARNRQAAFKRYLARKAKIWVPAEWCTVDEAVNAIRSAGGISVLAHAGRYDLNRRSREQLATEFAAAGGDAIEVSYPNLDPNMRKFLFELAAENHLRYSVGSDFHDASATWTAIGKFQPLRSAHEQNAVWHHPNWRER